ncbi:RNA polymerase sigma factor [Arcicella rosea]|uniref:RNA polymerase sigma factor (Sigma-70 family) n=1 Tax=Arcicella rosea TaxID=502909 RepID=A0A841EQV2_9BACT|nr:sigma-70 family RNA polymerase sigma factor [Arcicella rosea]MBB6003749.1 RNA polymerase sigma factor (sigma-70 family) [Arcicella rosea]
MKIVTLHTREQASDSLLWLNFKNGDGDALSELMRRYFRSLLQYGTKFTKNKSLIEDTIQDLFLELLERKAYLSTPASVKNYLFKALRNNLIRAVNKSNLSTDFLEQDDEQMIEFENIEFMLMQEDDLNELLSKFNEYFKLLTKRQKEALYLRYYENLSHEEISVIMDINKQSVSNLLQQSIVILRNNWLASIFLLSLID